MCKRMSCFNLFLFMNVVSKKFFTCVFIFLIQLLEKAEAREKERLKDEARRVSADILMIHIYNSH